MFNNILSNPPKKRLELLSHNPMSPYDFFGKKLVKKIGLGCFLVSCALICVFFTLINSFDLLIYLPLFKTNFVFFHLSLSLHLLSLFLTHTHGLFNVSLALY